MRWRTGICGLVLEESSFALLFCTVHVFHIWRVNGKVVGRCFLFPGGSGELLGVLFVYERANGELLGRELTEIEHF